MKAFPLAADDRDEVLTFLSERPIHTVAMAGFIRDNGVISEYNRGTFYGCRDLGGQLEGVALIGHAILIEARSERAIRALAELAKGVNGTHMIMAEEKSVATFLKYYIEASQEFARESQQVLLELQWPLQNLEEVEGLRLGTLSDLDLVVPVHAAMSFDESGVDPMTTDAVGFANRCARRLQRNRTYVLVENNELLFKADVIAETPEATYLEGVWASPKISGNGCARRCLTQLAKILLGRTKSICLLSNIENEKAQAFYLKSGFTRRGIYDSIFVKHDFTPVEAQ
jgi:predicted GNAT family acetyltransferase